VLATKVSTIVQPLLFSMVTGRAIVDHVYDSPLHVLHCSVFPAPPPPGFLQALSRQIKP
jgi:hypothetical protein